MDRRAERKDSYLDVIDARTTVALALLLGITRCDVISTTVSS